METDESLALKWVESQIAKRTIELDLLMGVRELLRGVVGEGQPDGWAQVGSRAGQND